MTDIISGIINEYIATVILRQGIAKLSKVDNCKHAKKEVERVLVVGYQHEETASAQVRPESASALFLKDGAFATFLYTKL